MPTLIDNRQPSLVITEFMAAYGIYPSPGGGGSGAYTMGMVRMFAGNFSPGGDIPADGRLLQIFEHEALFNLIGTTYGGDGLTTFAAPDLGGRVAVSAGTSAGVTRVVGETFGTNTLSLTQSNLPISHGGADAPMDNHQETLTTQYLIRMTGYFMGGPGAVSLAEVVQFTGNFIPAGYAACAGQLLPIAQNQALFALLGTTYGGNGVTTFALPDLRGRAPVGVDGFNPLGTMSGTRVLDPAGLNMPGEMGGADIPMSNGQPTLALNYMIALQGVFPSHDSGSAPSDAHYVGEIVLYAGNQPPDGFAFCNGQILPISQNTALFSLLGTQYGGNGTTTFALPDFRGRVAVNSDADDGLIVGDTFGEELVFLDTADMPALSINGTAAGDSLFGGDDNDVLSGLEGADILIGNLGADFLSGSAGNDQAFGGGGADTLQGGAGRDVLDGGDGDDSLNGGAGDDEIDGGLGDDAMQGADGADTLNGRSGIDSLVGGDGDDKLNGGQGDDILNGGAGADRLTGGDGVDTAVYLGSDAGVTVNLTTGVGSGGYAQGETLTQVENLTGSNRNDVLSGDALGNVLSGEAGDDTLGGGGGNDQLIGGGGSDRLNGGGGADAFIFRGASGADTINDFGPGSGDVIVLDASIFFNFANVLANTSNDGLGNCVIAKGGVSITLKGVIKGQLAASDFTFMTGAPSLAEPKPGDDSLVLPDGLDGKAAPGEAPVVCPPADELSASTAHSSSVDRGWDGRHDIRDFAWII